jgi:HK97 family phage prohead protease
MTTMPMLRDNLIRAYVAPEAAELRATATNGRTLTGYFAVFNRWTEIQSRAEGHFLERIAPGAFKGVFADPKKREQVKVLYDHGHDPQLGNKPLGPIRELREDNVGARYEVDLIGAAYNDEFIIPAAKAGVLGASFRFMIPDDGENWTTPSEATDYNMDRLEERTILRVDPLYEFGPVTFPAYHDGTQTGIRSLTDDYIDRLLHDPLFIARFTARAGLPAVERIIENLPPTVQASETTTETSPPAERVSEPTTTATRSRVTAEQRRKLRAELAARLEAIA